MIVSKFGGTSVNDAEAITRLVGLVSGTGSAREVVVVSALAGVTDALLSATPASVSAIARRYLDIAAELDVDTDPLVTAIGPQARHLARWIVGAGRPRGPRERDFVLSHGELWSSRLIAAALRRAGIEAIWIDARALIVTDGSDPALPNEARLHASVTQALGPLRGRAVAITQGFIGADPRGTTTTLGRGGSDYSAALLGAALGADLVEIWTDVDGLLTADPRIVPEALRLDQVGYDEAARLAEAGAKVLHPATIAPLAIRGIACWVGNSFRPTSLGTRIVARRCADHAQPALAIASKEQHGIAVVTVLGLARSGLATAATVSRETGAELQGRDEATGDTTIAIDSSRSASLVRRLHAALFGHAPARQRGELQAGLLFDPRPNPVLERAL